MTPFHLFVAAGTSIAAASAGTPALPVVIASVVGLFIPGLVDFILKSTVPTPVKTIVATAGSAVAAALATVTYSTGESWKAYVYAIVLAVVASQGGHRILVGLGDPIQRRFGDAGIGPARKLASSAPSRRLYVVNLSTLVSTADVRKMVTAINTQLRDHVAPAWGVSRVIVEYHAGTSLAAVQASVPPGSWVIGIFDTTDEANALGWHSVDAQDRVYGQIAAKPSLDNGSTALAGVYAVSATLSHEAIETLLDAACNGWCDNGRGLLIAREGCDPVEADGYVIGGVQVSNFILPAWADPSAVTGPYDYMSRTKAPFSMSAGGYWVQMKSGAQTQKFNRTVTWLRQVGFDVRAGSELVFSPEMPLWRRDLKEASGRNLRKRILTK